MSRSLIVLPDDSAAAIVAAIADAKKRLRIKMFVFSDPTLADAVIAAHKRGVQVQVMLNPARRGGEAENEATRHRLEQAGIDVRDSNPAFAVTHEKSMLVDDEAAFVKSLNWASRNLTETRDYAIVTRHAYEVDEVREGFEADWNRTDFRSGQKCWLIWCNTNGRERIAQFIDGARHTLFVQNERYQDQVIIERLVRAKTRGVRVHVMARPPHTLKEDKLVEGVSGLRILADVGIRVRKLKHLRLHGKLLLADSARAIVGSINLTPGSFDTRRELAIEVEDRDIVDRLDVVAEHDWKHSRALDLSDEGLTADLAKRNLDGTEQLALGTASDEQSKHRPHDDAEAVSKDGSAKPKA